MTTEGTRKRESGNSKKKGILEECRDSRGHVAGGTGQKGSKVGKVKWTSELASRRQGKRDEVW